jgi:hypothetical protein
LFVASDPGHDGAERTDGVHLNITAVPGAGNLLGNLICAIAGLLNPGGPLTQIVALLNQILDLLGL